MKKDKSGKSLNEEVSRSVKHGKEKETSSGSHTELNSRLLSAILTVSIVISPLYVLSLQVGHVFSLCNILTMLSRGLVAIPYFPSLLIVVQLTIRKFLGVN